MSSCSRIADIILLGPIRAGKSTIGRLLAEALNVPQASMDEFCWDYYNEIGFDRPGENVHGPDGMIADRFTVHALERLLADHRECGLDLGGGHAAISEEALLHRAQQLLENYPNVFLLLPSPDMARSDAILAERNIENDWLQGFIQKNGWNPNEIFLRHPANVALAKHIVYTDGKTPEETRDEILALVNPRPRQVGRHTRTKRKSDMIAALTTALEEAQDGCLRSLVLITMPTDADAGSFARIQEEDQEAVCEHLSGLKEDISC